MTSAYPGQDGCEPRAITEFAWAKINLGLAVLGKRHDGYHEIATCMQTVDLRDELHAWCAGETTLSCSDADLSPGEENLVLRALKVFHTQVRPVEPLHLHLVKRIPMGAGLGGGSADAAAALRLCNRLSGFPCSADQLRDLGALVGSDVPFLITGGTAVATGRGERLRNVGWNGDFHYVLVHPSVHVATDWAYSLVDAFLTQDSEYAKFLSSVDSGGCVDHERLLGCLRNDFLPVVAHAYPIVADLLHRLRTQGAHTVSMTGSGSTVYGVFDDRKAAAAAWEALKARGYRSFLCRAAGPYG